MAALNRCVDPVKGFCRTTMCDQSGGHLRIESGNAEVVNNLFVQASRGGAIYEDGTGTSSFSYNLFKDNVTLDDSNSFGLPCHPRRDALHGLDGCGGQSWRKFNLRGNTGRQGKHDLICGNLFSVRKRGATQIVSHL